MSINFLTRLMLAALLVATQVKAAISPGEINISLKGKIINTACEVDANSENKNIDLGSWQTEQLRPAGAVSARTELVIRLINCPLGVPTSITLYGNTIGNGYLALNDSSTATNVALQFHSERNATLPIGQPGKEWVPLSDGTVVHAFGVNFIALTDNVGPGRAAADATFVINYP